MRKMKDVSITESDRIDVDKLDEVPEGYVAFEVYACPGCGKELFSVTLETAGIVECYCRRCKEFQIVPVLPETRKIGFT